MNFPAMPANEAQIRQQTHARQTPLTQLHTESSLHHLTGHHQVLCGAAACSRLRSPLTQPKRESLKWSAKPRFLRSCRHGNPLQLEHEYRRILTNHRWQS